MVHSKNYEKQVRICLPAHCALLTVFSHAEWERNIDEAQFGPYGLHQRCSARGIPRRVRTPVFDEQLPSSALLLQNTVRSAQGAGKLVHTRFFVVFRVHHQKFCA